MRGESGVSTAIRITVADYDRMIAEGYFPPGPKRHRVELIDGELRQMSPIGPPHERLVDRLARWSFKNTREDVVAVRIQESIAIPDLDSVPEPDIVWARERDHSTGRPLAAEILLIIEVADRSLAYDRGEKAAIYAAAGIADYWVVNVRDRCIEVFRQPAAGQYASHEIFRGPDVIHPLAFPDVALNLGDLFPAEA
jgi:Uma2 family endonuclease